MLVLLTLALALTSLAAVVAGYFLRDYGQHSGSGTGALNVWDLTHRITQDHRHAAIADTYGRHALRLPKPA